MISTAVAPSLEFLDAPTYVILVDYGSLVQREVALHLVKRMEEVKSVCCEIELMDTVMNKARKPDTIFVFLQELERPFIAFMDSNAFLILRNILTSYKGVLWASKGGGLSRSLPHYGIIDGLSRAIRAENEKLVLVTTALDTENTTISQQSDNIYRVIRNTNFNSTQNDYESSFLEVNGVLQVGRIIEAKALTRKVYEGSRHHHSSVQRFGAGPPLEMRIGNLGLIDTIHFGEDQIQAVLLAPDEVEIQVHTVGLNFKDCLIALGRAPGRTLGAECAGIISRAGESSGFVPGERVCAATEDCFKTFARANSRFVIRIPHELAFTEAAALPATFVTAHIAIHHVARMSVGESILIHAGAGGTGQAAIQIAKRLNAEIFVTVGSAAKRQWLVDKYNIPEEHIFHSRDSSFAQGIRRMTSHGVDVIINSLAGENLVASWECIAPFGRFVEIGKKDILSNSSLPMSSFEKNASFHALDVSFWMKERPEIVHQAIEQIIDLVALQELHAAHPLHIYNITDIDQAFHFLQSGKSMGKIVVNIKEDAPVPVGIYYPRFLMIRSLHVTPGHA